MAITSKEINLRQLDAELGGFGLIADFNDKNKKVVTAAEGSQVTEEEIELAIDNHIALPENELSIEQKLASVGLDINELKSALGI